MADYQTKNAVLFIGFNRPDKTARVIEAISKVKPARLYVAVDGPRPTREADVALVNQVRELAQHITWPCDLRTQIREENLGCKMGPVTAMNWFFANETQGIILEDDCLPSPEFFRFADELLERYENDTRVMHISGTNLLNKRYTEDSYYFSRINHVWGWASWRRAWKLFEPDLTTLESDIANGLVPANEEELDYFTPLWRQAPTEGYDIWDFQWTYTLWKNRGVAAVPSSNLVTNIGHGPDATHTIEITRLANRRRYSIQWPLQHPKEVKVLVTADQYVWRRWYVQTALTKFKWHVKQFVFRAFK